MYTAIIRKAQLFPLQAYYGPGVMPPPYFGTSVVPGHAPHPYMWAPRVLEILFLFMEIIFLFEFNSFVCGTCCCRLAVTDIVLAFELYVKIE